MTDTPLVFAIPSKGRILESAQGFLDRSGLKPVQGRGARDYRGTIPGLDQVEVAFLSASDIAKELAAGTAHIGLTGLDLMHEATPEPEDRLVSLAPLGFSRADVVVAVPQAWIDVSTMADLDDVASLSPTRPSSSQPTPPAASTSGPRRRSGIASGRREPKAWPRFSSAPTLRSSSACPTSSTSSTREGSSPS